MGSWTLPVSWDNLVTFHVRRSRRPADPGRIIPLTSGWADVEKSFAFAPTYFVSERRPAATFACEMKHSPTRLSLVREVKVGGLLSTESSAVILT
ncbi:hypothetical protein GCM10023100_15770 [Actinocorallia cavernae]|uniref:Uncharacterized protein n=2 Tax=Actinomycetes TaxID=1760 RepID=A0ABP8SDL9_9ACTN|nr:hypothetical protein SRO_1520 [Streptomyces rochei]